MQSSPPVRRRFTGLLPQLLTRYRAPSWWQEVALVGIGYWLYGLARNAVPEHASIALRHGRALQHLQDAIGLNWELSLNKYVAGHESLAQVFDYYYATMHFIVTSTVLIWLFVRRQHIYRGIRTVLFATSLIGLAGFWLYPLAPPRMLEQYGYIDTVTVFKTWGSWADPNIAKHSNQFAAMPSLHIAWALWAGITLFLCARRPIVRAFGVFHPVMTLFVILGTANHFILDAVAGAAVLAMGFAVQQAMSGHGAYSWPEDSPVTGRRAATHFGEANSGSEHELASAS